MREGAHGGFGVYAQGRGGGDGGRGVVEVVGRRQADGGGEELPVHAQLGEAAVRLKRVHLDYGDVGLRAGVAALRAAEAAQVGEGVVVVLVLSAAEDAAGRVRDRGGLAQGRVHAEKAHPVRRVRRERGGQRAVRVQADPRLGRTGQALAYAGEGVSHLAVAVQLVTEDVRHDGDCGFHLPADAAEGGLVALNDGEAAAGLPEEAGVRGEVRGDAALQVRAGAVGEAVPARVPGHLLQHAAGGGLAVRAGDHNRRHAAGQPREHVRADAQGNFARQGRAAPPGQPERQAHQLAEQYGKEKSHLYTSLQQLISRPEAKWPRFASSRGASVFST